MSECGTNAIKLRAASVKNVVIVANAAIHCELIATSKLDTGLRRHDEAS